MSSIRLGSQGSVYILSNAAMPGLLKIGSTTGPVEERAKQLTAATASPAPFTVLYHREVADCTTVEEQMHAAFADRRVNDRREFFRVSLYEAARTLDALSGEIFSRLEPALPFSELFASFEDRGDGVLNADEQRQCRELEARLIQ